MRLNPRARSPTLLAHRYDDVGLSMLLHGDRSLTWILKPQQNRKDQERESVVDFENKSTGGCIHERCMNNLPDLFDVSEEEVLFSPC